MNKLSQFSLILSTVLFSFLSPSHAIEINNQQYCYLTIEQPDRSTFKILVPNDQVQTISKQLNVVGINCRGSN